ncbi:MAG: pyrroloquinoline quinone biosynthesis protein PqqE [Rhodospirillales bacterium]|nr:pyrroloquinoline quinone biosynthesis protein PqqE [Rhodospirillales bacterium]
MSTIAPPPLALQAEITHRCPMRCVYCSNPLALEPRSRELDTAEWCRVLDQAATLGCLQVHFSGGEPTARSDLAQLVAHASAAGLYTNLITSGVMLDEATLATLATAGLEHAQISFQDVEVTTGDRIGGLKGAHARKLGVARMVVEAGLALTVNAVVHRHNADRVAEMIELAVALRASRIEVAHVQYYGWGLKNRASLMPTRAQLEHASAVVEAARERLRGRLVIDYVIPDYWARLPKACMGGWGQRFILIDPAGRALPCHAATTIPGMIFDNVRDRPLDEIWARGAAFERFRGTAWMPEPCTSCERQEIDWGGCRCQALALTGDAAATDPVCWKSPQHRAVRALAQAEAMAPGDRFVYRGAPQKAPV